MIDLNTTHQIAAAAVQAGDGITQWSVNPISILRALLIMVTLGFLWAMSKMSTYVSKTWKESEERRTAQIDKEFTQIKEIITSLVNKMEDLGHALVTHERDNPARHFALSERMTKAEIVIQYVDRRGKPVIPDSTT